MPLVHADFDVQRFGDHLDVLANEAQVEAVHADVLRVLAGDGIAVSDVRTDEPTLENVKRSMGELIPAVARRLEGKR